MATRWIDVLYSRIPHSQPDSFVHGLAAEVQQLEMKLEKAQMDVELYKGALDAAVKELEELKPKP